MKSQREFISSGYPRLMNATEVGRIMDDIFSGEIESDDSGKYTIPLQLDYTPPMNSQMQEIVEDSPPSPTMFVKSVFSSY